MDALGKRSIATRPGWDMRYLVQRGEAWQKSTKFQGHTNNYWAMCSQCAFQEQPQPLYCLSGVHQANELWPTAAGATLSTSSQFEAHRRNRSLRILIYELLHGKTISESASIFKSYISRKFRRPYIAKCCLDARGYQLQCKKNIHIWNVVA